MVAIIMFFVKSSLTNIFLVTVLILILPLLHYMIYIKWCVFILSYLGVIMLFCLMAEQINWPLFCYLVRIKTTLEHVHTC